MSRLVVVMLIIQAGIELVGSGIIFALGYLVARKLVPRSIGWYLWRTFTILACGVLWMIAISQWALVMTWISLAE